MPVWVISDLHLSFGTPDKSMDIFGPAWEKHGEKIQKNWTKVIKKDDLILIPGDISWAMRTDEALIDLTWIDSLPGTKVIIKGNHDYWWPSNTKLKEILPSSIHFIYNSAFSWNGIAIGGTRLWDTPEYQFNSLISYRENPYQKKLTQEEREGKKAQEESIFIRELERLKFSLKQMDPKAKIRIAMTHYPLISADLQPSQASKILEEYHIQYCVFGHLHNVKKEQPIFGEKNGILYTFTSCDYLDFNPLLLIP